MKIEVRRASVKFIREEGDPKFYGVKEAKGESNLFHFLKKQMAAGHKDLPKGFPTVWIKKRMWKDGHMVDDMQQYLRTRKPVGKTKDGTRVFLSLHNTQWAIDGAERWWNDGSVVLELSVIPVCEPELSLKDPARIEEQSQRVWDQIGKEIGIE